MSLSELIQNAANQIEKDLLQLKNIITYEQNLSNAHSVNGISQQTPVPMQTDTDNIKKKYDVSTAIVLGTITGITMITLEYFMTRH